MRGRSDSPVFHVGATRQSVADDHDVVFGVVELSPRLVRYGDLLEHCAFLELEAFEVGDGLVGYQTSELGDWSIWWIE